MAHLITPITIETESGDYDEFYRFPPPGFTHTTQTSDFQSCCSYYYNLGYPIETILLTEALFGKTNHTVSPGTYEPGLGSTGTGALHFLLLSPDSPSDPDQTATGFVRFGVCCGEGKYLNLNVYGELSHFYDDVDSLTIKVNGAEVWSHASSIAEGNSLSTDIFPPDGELPIDDHPEDPLYWSNALYSFQELGVSIPLPGLPCGDIVTIEASSVTVLRPDGDHPPRYPRWNVNVVSIA